MKVSLCTTHSKTVVHCTTTRPFECELTDAVLISPDSIDIEAVLKMEFGSLGGYCTYHGHNSPMSQRCCIAFDPEERFEMTADEFREMLVVIGQEDTP